MSNRERNSTQTKRASSQYPIELHFVSEEDGDGYYFAFLPDFGHSACSAVGDTPMEALDSLNEVKEEVLEFLKETGREIPVPSCNPTHSNELQQTPFRISKTMHRQAI